MISRYFSSEIIAFQKECIEHRKGWVKPEWACLFCKVIRKHKNVYLMSDTFVEIRTQNIFYFLLVRFRLTNALSLEIATQLEPVILNPTQENLSTCNQIGQAHFLRNLEA